MLLGLTFKPLLGQTQFGCQINEEKGRKGEWVGEVGVGRRGVMHCTARNERMTKGKSGCFSVCVCVFAGERIVSLTVD